HHLAAVADAERKRIRATEEARELFSKLRMEQDRLGPALACAEHVAIGESAAGDETAIVGETRASAYEVRHVHVVGLEAGAVQGGCHLDVAVHALLAQDRDLRSRAL